MEHDIFLENCLKKVKGILLYIIPSHPKVIDRFIVYILNATGHDIHLQYEAKAKGELLYADHVQLLARTKACLAKVPYDDFINHIKWLFIIHPLIQINAYYTVRYSPKAKDLMQYIIMMNDQDFPHWQRMLLETIPEEQLINRDVLEQLQFKSSAFKNRNSRSVPHAQINTIIDLHIEAIGKDYHHKTGAEILALQLHHFESHLYRCITCNASPIIVIHGIGKGVLKAEIIKYLATNKYVKSYANNYHPSYGYGATEIHLH